MASASFSHAVTECHLCPPPIVTEYAPADRIKLSNSKGHDDWPYYLIVGDQWLVSHAGSRWLSESADHNHPFMVLGDPRVLLRIATDPEVEESEEMDGRSNHVVRAGTDSDRLLSEVWPAEQRPAGTEGEQPLHYFREMTDGLKVRFWIDARDFTITQMELDYSLLPADNEEEPPEDPEPYVIQIDYETPVDVPEEPEAMPYQEADRLRREAGRRIQPLLDSIAQYRSLNGLYPPSLDPETLSDVLPATLWPVNPFTDEPMRQAEDSPGDFYYEVKNAGSDYVASFYGWDATYSYIDTIRFGRPDEMTNGKPRQ
ncbi:MAG: hypothetical protein A2W34_00460 [Chloroflexi bacterium RBG_16_64_32]|nr:MAG: hypothetical protein A2W34_00460 [Chloroflexi bacterium RBG_16_64_32]